jgi:hypothetical protein
MSQVRIASYGLAVTPPAGWEARIYKRDANTPGTRTLPVLHAATVPLPAERGDYGSGVVETLGGQDVFVALLDFGTEAAGTALFAATGIPGLTPDMYQPHALQRVLAGQAGVQRFFTHNGHGYCLYSVVGSFANRGPLCYQANQIIGSLEVGNA